MTDTPAERVLHTPGPWRKAGGYVRGLDCIVCKVGSYESAEIVRQSKARWEADSRLIAAAPKLLAAAKKVCAEAGPDMPPSMGSLAELDSAVRQATGTTDV